MGDAYSSVGRICSFQVFMGLKISSFSVVSQDNSQRSISSDLIL